MIDFSISLVIFLELRNNLYVKITGIGNKESGFSHFEGFLVKFGAVCKFSFKMPSSYSAL